MTVATRDFYWDFIFLANIFLGKKIRKKLALRGSKMNKRAIFTSFSLILAPKTALELIFAAACRIQCFVRKVSYDVLSSEIMLMGQVQAGPGRY